METDTTLLVTKCELASQLAIHFTFHPDASIVDTLQVNHNAVEDFDSILVCVFPLIDSKKLRPS